MYSISRTRKPPESIELTSPFWSAHPLAFPSRWIAGSGLWTWTVGVRREHLKSAKRESLRSSYAPYRLLSRVHIFAVLNPATLEFGPRVLAVCCGRRALGGAWWLLFGRLGHAVKPRRRGTAEASKDFCRPFSGHQSRLNGIYVIGTRCALYVKPFRVLKKYSLKEATLLWWKSVSSSGV